MAAKKKVDPIKQREKRAKIAAIGGVVLLLAVAAWQGPKMMKLMNQKPVVPPPSAAAPVGTSALPGTRRADDDHRVGRACGHGRAAGCPRRRPARLVRRLPDEGSVPAAGHERGRGGCGRRGLRRDGDAERARHGLGRRVVRTTTHSLDRGAVDHDAGDRRALDAGGAEHYGDHHDRQARRADRLDLRQRRRPLTSPGAVRSRAARPSSGSSPGRRARPGSASSAAPTRRATRRSS